MHGSIQRELTSCRSLRSSCSRHMRSVLPLVKKNSSVVIEGGQHSSLTSSETNTTTSDSFLKDGRKISVGDCALFKQTQELPPYIGLIRWLRFDEENILQVGVNWLYRPSEIKLSKGALVEGAPNEIFYSFHEDEILAASLLHPCKVSFLPRGVGLPSGTSSFVCRRVYDIANKCLWWLTDEDYIDDQQEEVDQLLYKTRFEMHATLHSGGCSPKQVNGPPSTSQIKSVSDSVQNSGITSHSLMKGKKREKGEHGSEQVKNERCTKTDDIDSLQCKTENNLKSEISRITGKGGLVDLEAVEILVQLMQLDKTEGKIDLVNRSIIAGVVAATNKADCLDRFVQLRGLLVLDEWLQDIHKVKIGNSNSLKDSDVSVDEFLLVLLRALDKLPVDLQALQMCNIGRSVNHLRSHKSSEIQRKARSLVDMWKKRVEAEMITNEAKSGSTQAVSVWPSKSRVTGASHSGGRTPTSSDVAIKSSITQCSTSKNVSAIFSHVDGTIKSATLSPGHVKPVSSTLKESLIRVSAECYPVPLVREDRSSSSNQSHNQRQSSSKEESKSAAASLAAVSKNITGTQNRRTCGFSGSSVTGVPKEMCKVRSSSIIKNTTIEKLNWSSNVERVLDVNEGTSHKLIVKILNRAHSPAQGIAGGAQEDSAYCSNRVSSPVLLYKHEQLDRTSEEKTDIQTSNVAPETNIDYLQCSDPKDVSPPLPDEKHSMTADSERSSQGPLLKSTKMRASFSPMNALMSCLKYSESNSSLSLDEDVGMNLLASVAAGEMSRSDLLSPADCTEGSTAVDKSVCPDDGEKAKSTSDDNIAACQSQFSKDALNDDLRERKLASSHPSEYLAISDSNKHSEYSNTEIRCKVLAKGEISEKSNEIAGKASLTCSISEKLRDEFIEDRYEDKGPTSNDMEENVAGVKTGGVIYEEKVSFHPTDSENNRKIIEDTASHPFNEGECKKEATDDLKLTVPNEKLVCGASNKNHTGEHANKGGEACGRLPDRLIELDRNASVEIHRFSCSYSASDEVKIHDKAVSIENSKIVDHVSVLQKLRPCSSKLDMLPKPELRGFSSDGVQSNEGENGPATSGFSEVAGPSEMDAKVEFDLNEGLNADEGKYGEPISLMSSGTTSVYMMNTLALSVKSIPRGHSASITVAAAAKGPFVPPDDLLRSKGELGWRGSAATSAFRPAEPRKVLETPLVLTSMSISEASASEHGRAVLDFDLNVPDERVLQEIALCEVSDMKANFASGYTKFLNEPSISVRCSGGLDLDLNKVDGACDTGNFSKSSHRKGDIYALNLKPYDGLLAADARRDLDLNNGPGVEDGGNADQFFIRQQIKVGMPTEFSTAAPRMNGPGHETFSSWFPPGIPFSTTTFPSMLPDRGEHQFPVFPPIATQRAFSPSAVTSFTPEIYRGSVLSSSPVMPFPSSSFQFPLYPFGATHPLQSATLPVGATSYVESSSGSRLYVPPMHSQLLGPVTPQFQRPYTIALPDSSNNGSMESNRRCVRQGFDLNAGPGSGESEVREEMFPMASGQHSVSSSQALTEEQARIYSVSSGIIKRKEPDGGWDSENFRFKQSSWQ